MLSMEIEFRELLYNELHEGLLLTFERFQETHTVLVQSGHELTEKKDHFIDQWDLSKKRLVVLDLRNCVEAGGFVIGAFNQNCLIGFANVESKKLGSAQQYRELSYIHVSRESRGLGIGKKLFKYCAEAARRQGAEKLYIAAHPSLETQLFYQHLGCIPAEEIIREIFEKEPLDLQMEYIV